MVLLHIGGIEVDFPYEPYGVQKQYMARVIAALRGGQNACLESPTGTGKSLSLLCSVLAWRQAYVAALQLRANGGYDEKLFKATGLMNLAESSGEGVGAARSRDADGDGTRSGDTCEARVDSGRTASAEGSVADALFAAVIPGSGPRGLRAPRIVFTSRTHSQLSQAIRELRVTVYRPFMTVLASRDQLCVHDIARKYSGPRLNSACRGLTGASKRGCQYHLAVMSPREHENRSSALLQELKDSPPMDIEDLGAFGLREGACPWFLTRAAAAAGEVEILFMPYNYLVDRDARESIDMDWGNDVILVDEAHNLESVCTESLSFDLTPAIRHGCQRELQKCIEDALRPGGVGVPVLEELARTPEGEVKVIGSENREVMEYRILLVMLRQLEEAIEKVTLPNRGSGEDVRSPSTYATFRGGFIRDLVCSVEGITAETVPLVLEVLEKAVDGSSSSSELAFDRRRSDVPVGAHSSCLRVLHKALRLAFDPATVQYEDGFRTVIQAVEGGNPSKGRSISLWCFNPAVAMSQIFPLGVRSLILTSGTLSPMETLPSELGIRFPVRLEGRHVIGPDQVFGAIVNCGPDGYHLSSNFKVREKDEYKLSLGRALIEVAGVVPDGMLVFFPSYRAMDACGKFWRSVGVGDHGQRPSIIELLYQRKQLVWEPRNSSDFAATILAHQNHIRSGRGSILFAVCRGKVSEGIDFSDAYGRAVVLAGIPYPAAYDVKVLLKKNYMDENKQKALQPRSCKGDYGKVDESTLYIERRDAHSAVARLSGDDWYSLQAVRAINQALGRVIRHKSDYGCILLFDERFSSAFLQSKLSRWLKPYMVASPSFGAAISHVSEFFARAKGSKFAASSSLKAVRSSEASGKLHSTLPPTAERASAQVDADAQIAAASEAIARFLHPQPAAPNVLKHVSTRHHAEVRDQESGAEGVTSARDHRESDCGTSQLLDVLGGRPSEAGQGEPQRGGAVTTSPGGSPSIGVMEVMPETTTRVTASAEFLRKRQLSGKLFGTGGSKSSRGRVSVGSRDEDTLSLPAAKRLKLSEMAKALFDDKQHFTDAFMCLRRILGLARELAEQDGPLLTSATREEITAKGRLEVSSLVDCIRYKKAPGVNAAQVESFLEMLRPKIPVPFLQAFDAEIKCNASRDA